MGLEIAALTLQTNRFVNNVGFRSQLLDCLMELIGFRMLEDFQEILLYIKQGGRVKRDKRGKMMRKPLMHNGHVSKKKVMKLPNHQ